MKAGGWAHIALVYLLGVVAFVSMGMLGPLAGDFARELSSTVQAVGAVIGLQVCGGAAFGALIGWVVDRFGARPVMLGGSGLLVLSNAINVHVTTLISMGAGVLVQSMGLFAVVLGCQVVLSTGVGVGRQQLQALSLWSTAPFVGVALGLFLVAPFADSPGWRDALYIQMGLGAFGLVVVAVLPAVRVVVEKARVWDVFHERKVLRLAVGFAAISLVGQGNNTVMSLYMHSAHGVSVASAATTLGMANLAGIVGSFAMAAALSRGAQPGRVLWTIVVAGVVGGTCMYTAQFGYALAVTGLLIWTTVMGATVAFVYTLVARVAPHPGKIGAAAGLVNQGSGVGIVLAAPLFFAIYASGRWIWFAVVIAAAWAIVALTLPVRGLPPLARVTERGPGDP